MRWPDGSTARVGGRCSIDLHAQRARSGDQPVVLVATAVTFPGQPEMVLARCLASLATAVVMGALVAVGCRVDQPPTPRTTDTDQSRWTAVFTGPPYDAAGRIVSGDRRRRGLSTLRVLYRRGFFQHVAGNLLIGVVTVTLLAFVLALMLGDRRVRRYETLLCSPGAGWVFPGGRPGCRRETRLRYKQVCSGDRSPSIPR